MKLLMISALGLLCACAHQTRTPANTADHEAKIAELSYDCKIKYGLNDQWSECGGLTISDEPTARKDSAQIRCHGEDLFLFWSRATSPGNYATLRFGTESRGNVLDALTIEATEIARPPEFHLSLAVNRSLLTKKRVTYVASCTRRD